MVFLLVWAGDTVSSDPAGDGGSGVSGLGALAGFCVGRARLLGLIR